MKLHDYPETDSLHIELRSGPSVETREVSEGPDVDLDEDGGPVGFDIAGASKMDLHTLETAALPVQALERA